MTGSLAGAIEFIRLEEALREFAAGERFVFVVNAGNWGDGLIRYATERFLYQKGLDYVAVKWADAMKASPDDLKEMASSDKVRMVYSGGGAFFKKYRMHRTMPDLIGKSHRMLVLPHTFGVSSAKLGFRKNDILFRRDRTGSTEFAPNAMFCHDMAFSLAPVVASSDGSGVGYFFRNDREKIEGMRLPEGNRDISAEGTESTPMAAFLDGIAQFQTIHTNRLHVAISGALMGRKVNLYANSYFKNQAIYQASLERAFPNVSFHQEFNEQ